MTESIENGQIAASPVITVLPVLEMASAPSTAKFAAEASVTWDWTVEAKANPRIRSRRDIFEFGFEYRG